MPNRPGMKLSQLDMFEQAGLNWRHPRASDAVKLNPLELELMEGYYGQGTRVAEGHYVFDPPSDSPLTQWRLNSIRERAARLAGRSSSMPDVQGLPEQGALNFNRPGSPYLERRVKYGGYFPDDIPDTHFTLEDPVGGGVMSGVMRGGSDQAMRPYNPDNPEVHVDWWAGNGIYANGSQGAGVAPLRLLNDFIANNTNASNVTIEAFAAHPATAALLGGHRGETLTKTFPVARSDDPKSRAKVLEQLRAIKMSRGESRVNGRMLSRIGEGALDDMSMVANPASLYTMMLPYEAVAPIMGAANITNDVVPPSEQSDLRGLGNFAGITPWIENTGMGRGVAKLTANLAKNMFGFNSETPEQSILDISETGKQGLVDIGKGWAESPIFNTLNLLSLGQFGNGGRVSPQLGAVKHSRGPGNVPMMRDPETGVQFGPTSTQYFGRDPAEQAAHLAKIRDMLRSSSVDMDMLVENVPTKFGTELPGARAQLGPTTGYASGPRWEVDNPFILDNTRQALRRIPTKEDFNIYFDNDLLKEHPGMVGRAFAGPTKYATVAPSKYTMYGTLPHELQHLNDFSNKQPLFSETADINGLYNLGGLSPTSAMNSFMLESRAELAAQRFIHYLRTNGVYHWWDEPGTWPK